MKYSKLGRIFSLSFLGLAFVAFLFPVVLVLGRVSGSEFSALYLLLLAAPWSFLFSSVFEGFSNLLSQLLMPLSGTSAYLLAEPAFAIFSLLPLLLGALINAGILYCIGMLFDSSPRREGATNEAASLPQTNNVTPLPQIAVNRTWRKFNIFFWLFLLLPLLSLVIPIEVIADNVATMYFFATIGISIGRIVVLSYFGYAITQNKRFLMLGLLGLPGFFGIGMCIGYLILRRVKNKLIHS